MSHEHGGPAPVPDPYAAPEPVPAPSEPSEPSEPTEPTEPTAPVYVAPVPPSGYEAVRTPVGQTAPSPPSGPAPEAASPYAAPVSTPYGQQPPPAAGGPQYGAPQYGAPQYGAQYGAPQLEAPPYGAPQYGAPQYGAPGYAQAAPPYGGQPYGYPQPYAAPPTEGMAIASFVTSLAGLLFLGGLPGPVGLGLGIAALRRIKTNGKSGRGWAIAGIAIGAVGILSILAILAYIVFALVFVTTVGTSSSFWDGVQEGIEEGSGGTPDAGAELPDYTIRTDLTAGTCLSTYAWDYDMADTGPVDCAVPHEAEVVGLVEMSGPVSMDPADEFDTAYNDAWDACDQLTEALVPTYFADGNIELYYPHPDDFAAGTTSAYCVFYGDAPGMTGSATAGTLHLNTESST